MITGVTARMTPQTWREPKSSMPLTKRCIQTASNNGKESGKNTDPPEHTFPENMNYTDEEANTSYSDHTSTSNIVGEEDREFTSDHVAADGESVKLDTYNNTEGERSKADIPQRPNRIRRCTPLAEDGRRPPPPKQTV